MKKTLSYFLCFVAVTYTLVSFHLHLFALPTRSAKTSRLSSHNGFDWSAKRFFFKQSTFPKYKINLEYPVLTLASSHIDQSELDLANQMIMKIIERKHSEFLNYTINSFDYTLQPEQTDYWSCSGTYRITHLSQTVISIRFDFDSFMGGAHERIDIDTLTLQLNPFKVITMSDLFQKRFHRKAISEISSQTRVSLSNDLQDTQYEKGIQIHINAGTTPQPSNFKNFILSREGLQLIFPPYQVASFNHGTREVIISWSHLDRFLAGSIAKQIYQQKRST